MRKKELAPSPERADFVSIGLYMVVDAICKQLQLDELLEGVMEEDRARMILDLASYMIQSENNVMQYVDDYCYNHALFSDYCFEDSAVGKLMDSISIKDIDVCVKLRRGSLKHLCMREWICIWRCLYVIWHVDYSRDQLSY